MSEPGARAVEWHKLGVLTLEDRAPWAASHVALPVAEQGADGSLVVYFSARDAQGRSRIGVADLDVTQSPMRLVSRAEPVLELGPLGAFDESGVTVSCVVHHQGRRFLYYTGWTRGVTVPFYFYVGLAVSDDGGRTFVRMSPAPILERSEVDPYLTASPWVLVEGSLWRMWYVSGVKWIDAPGGPKHLYHVKYAESDDGVTWRRQGVVCIDFASPEEHAFGRPCVLRDADGVYRMWYSYRGAQYRIGYAESHDGLSWTRMDGRAGIDVSASGWDSEMIEYPHVFDVGGHRYMLYNGNNYGGSGMGLAVRP